MLIPVPLRCCRPHVAECNCWLPMETEKRPTGLLPGSASRDRYRRHEVGLHLGSMVSSAIRSPRAGGKTRSIFGRDCERAEDDAQQTHRRIHRVTTIGLRLVRYVSGLVHRHVSQSANRHDTKSHQHTGARTALSRGVFGSTLHIDPAVNMLYTSQ